MGLTAYAMILWLTLAGLAFGFTAHVLDRPSIPTWKGKYLYRLIAWICWLGWVGTVLKAIQWHTELVTLMPYVAR